MTSVKLRNIKNLRRKHDIVLIIIWNFHRIVSSLRAARKNLTIHCALSSIFVNHESFMMLSSNSWRSWLSHETKNTCFNSSNASSSLYKALIIEHVSMTNVFILQNWFWRISLMWFNSQWACVFAFIVFVTSTSTLKWNSSSFDVAVFDTCTHRFMTFFFRILVDSSLKKFR